MTDPKKPSRKMFFSMGEVSEMFDVNPSLIRFWEKRFDVLKPHKNAKGNRMFTPEDVENLKLIYHLVKEKGMTLAGAEKYIKDNKNALQRDVQILEHLGRIRAALLEIKSELGSETTDTEIVVRTEALAEAVNEALPEPVTIEEALDQQSEAETSTDVQPSVPEAAAATETAPQTEPQTAPGPKPRYIEPTLFDL
ncbi:MerR family transcriptional regulator [Millionella massiliensis]|uniref:MerR family transcriptional regulator n=1 Tax=Millionella massiliensis TaxID=1871023 RepID=UPI0009F40D84|nr:MerR family transcriptional regulator [Millionella massiliensis]